MRTKTKIIAAVCIALITFSAISASSSTAQSICEYTAADDKRRLRTLLKTNKLKVRNIYDSVQCNGEPLLRFADSAESVKVGKYFISKLPKKVIAQHSFRNAELAKAAEERLN